MVTPISICVPKTIVNRLRVIGAVKSFGCVINDEPYIEMEVLVECPDRKEVTFSLTAFIMAYL
jgi:hypothetical protein